MTHPEFIVYAFPWDEQKGGHMVLHALCERLNELGYSAALWRDDKPVELPHSWRTLRSWAGYLLRGRFAKRYASGPFSHRFARRSDVKKATVIYPEVVAGNPLGARKVARWLLYTPGVHTGVVNHGRDEIVFYNNEQFNLREPGRQVGGLLRVNYLNPVYQDRNIGQREGSCVIIRKGRSRDLNRHPPEATLVDEISHEERAEIFNRCTHCYSYDLYTYLNIYAALCGCTPIIIPREGLAESEWLALEDRYGQAYGEGKIEWARETLPDLRRVIEQRRATEDASVHQFVDTCRTVFAG